MDKVNVMSDSTKAFESIARAAGFHDFDVSGNGCYSDDFLQHFYAGWEARETFRQALSSCSENPNSSDPASRQALEGEPFTWVFTDVNGQAKEIAGDPVHRSPQDLRIYTALYTHPASCPEIPDSSDPASTEVPDEIAQDYSTCLEILGVTLDVGEDIPICLSGFVEEIIKLNPVGAPASRQALECEPLYIVLAEVDNCPEQLFVEIETGDGRSVSAGVRETHAAGQRLGPFYTHPASADVPDWEAEAKRAFWTGLEIGASMGAVSIAPRWNEYIAKRKGEMGPDDPAKSVSTDRPGLGQRKAAQVGKTIGVLVQRDDGGVVAVTDLGRCTMLRQDVTGAGDGASVPEDGEYLRALQDAFDIIQADANTEQNYGSLCRIGGVLAKLKATPEKAEGADNAG